jgi:hypothetical protein
MLKISDLRDYFKNPAAFFLMSEQVLSHRKLSSALALMILKYFGVLSVDGSLRHIPCFWDRVKKFLQRWPADLSHLGVLGRLGPLFGVGKF